MLKKIFLNDRLTLLIIFLNAVSIFVSESGIYYAAVFVVDLFATIYFIIEMVVKHLEYGLKGYWSDGWNRLDGTLVILSLPSLIGYFVDLSMVDLSVLLVLRLMRVLRFFRVLHFFPGFSRMVDAFRQAMTSCYSVLISFAVIVIVVGLVNCALFRDMAPDFFGTPTSSIYSVFRLCTIEGWYEIPDVIGEASGVGWVAGLVRFYFCLLLIMGGIVGMSFINSIFVDAMVSDNNDAVEGKIDELSKQIAELRELLEEQKKG